jgi:hypothetical protein
MKIYLQTTIQGLMLFINSLFILNGSEPGVFGDDVFDNRIKTVQLYREEWNLSYPFIKKGSNDKLILGFDLISTEPETYYYSFVHCDKDWRESNIFHSDYIDGLPEEQLENYKPSFNTTVNYYHYRLLFPNEKVSIKLSGNYIIKVFRPGEPDKPVLTRRFLVVEELVQINAAVIRPQLTQFYNTGQQVNFTVSFSSLNANDPYRDFTVFILQNGKWINAKTNLKPDFIGSNELKFNSLSTKTIFPGGNEYRYFDIKSIRYQSEFIRKIDFVGSNYHVLLFPSENREFKPYFYTQDFNGKYYVAIQEGRNMDTDADYVYVYFTIPSRYKIEGGNLYVSGAMNNWAFDLNNRMTYDPQRGEYQCTMLLKQGWYNYEYIFIRDGEKNPEPSLFEGNHFETENDYVILVYYKSTRDRYDRLVGLTVKNTFR